MLSDSERKTLKSYLALAPVPEYSFTYDELLGYIFGIAITPDIIAPSEWQPVIFGGDMVDFPSIDQADSMLGCLTQVLNNAIGDFHNGKLVFPFNIKELNEIQLEQLYDWISGFEEALTLREEIWDPEENPNLPERKKEELYHSLLTIQGIVDPLEVMDFFDKIPDEIFLEAFPDLDPTLTSRDAQVQLFLLSSLPLAVHTLLEHAHTLEKKRQEQLTTEEPSKNKRSNVIKVDFKRKRK